MRLKLSLAALAVLAALPARAQSPGPESPPAPWFAIADMPSRDPAIATTRWLWNREARALRYCRKPVDKDDWACAPDVTLPEGRWVLGRIQSQPEPGVDSSARFYSPDLDRTLHCHAAEDGGFGCE